MSFKEKVLNQDGRSGNSTLSKERVKGQRDASDNHLSKPYILIWCFKVFNIYFIMI